MSFKDILSIVFSAEDDQAALAAASAIAPSGDAHLTAMLLQANPDAVYAMDGSMVTGVWAEVLARARKDFEAERDKLAKILDRAERRIDLRPVLVDASFVAAAAAMHARHADVTVMARHEGGPLSGLRAIVFEAVLFGSGRPVLLTPPDWRGGNLGKRVVVGWNAKREAARALADSMPILERADHVAVVTIDAKPGEGGYGEAPGVDIAAHLARHGLEVELRNADSLGREHGQVLLDEAFALNADLVVIGGYGRARLTEMVFGGVTKALTKASPLPLLMSH